jgi:hypothetical protein
VKNAELKCWGGETGKGRRGVKETSRVSLLSGISSKASLGFEVVFKERA